MRKPLRLLLLCASAIVGQGCGAAQDAAPRTNEQLACRREEAGSDRLDVYTDSEAVEIREPSAYAVSAKRHFDSERWEEAATHFMTISSGLTMDDPGNRQLARYYLAICHYRLRRFELSATEFELIASDRKHLKHPETLLWLAKLLDHPETTLRAVRAIGLYDPEHSERFRNPQQYEMYWKIEYALGRMAYRVGRFPEAARHLQNVDRRSVLYAQAQICRELAGS